METGTTIWALHSAVTGIKVTTHTLWKAMSGIGTKELRLGYVDHVFNAIAASFGKDIIKLNVEKITTQGGFS